jgi:hypothetical protein
VNLTQTQNIKIERESVGGFQPVLLAFQAVAKPPISIKTMQRALPPAGSYHAMHMLRMRIGMKKLIQVQRRIKATCMKGNPNCEVRMSMREKAQSQGKSCRSAAMAITRNAPGQIRLSPTAMMISAAMICSRQK